MHYLYGSKRDTPLRLVATFGSEQQLLAYLRWATLQRQPGKPAKFEQGSALAGFSDERHAPAPLTTEDPTDVPFNPTPSML